MNLFITVVDSIAGFLAPYIPIIAILANITLTVSYVPQIWSLYSTKDTSGIAPSFWYILDLSLFLLFIMALYQTSLSGEWGLFIAQALNLSLALVITGQVVYYNRFYKTKTIDAL